MKKAYTLLFDGYADWELGHVLAELRRLGNVEAKTAGFSDTSVVSMGGLRVQPDKVLSQVGLDDMLIFILPGGYLWEKSYPKEEIESFLHRVERKKIPIAAICSATTVLARTGLLKERKHTSNSLAYLSKMVPGYADRNNYVQTMAIRDRHIITASGLGSVDFTMEVLKELDLGTPAMRSTWYDAFKHGKYPENLPHE
ncbi:MAG: DJ-1/PfpI family protein [Proteobacteria bacterium]|nr:DJ-1/PfpI family protein [Pseudomonadota bacterium]